MRNATSRNDDATTDAHGTTGSDGSASNDDGTASWACSGVSPGCVRVQVMLVMKHFVCSIILSLLAIIISLLSICERNFHRCNCVYCCADCTHDNAALLHSKSLLWTIVS